MVDEDIYVFTAENRCDRCGAQAYMLARSGGSELFFCAHHRHEHGETLFNGGWTIIEDHEGLSRLGIKPMAAY